MLLYHTGFEEIKVPDIHVGRKNADFGQGFYLSTDLDFTKRWAKIRKDRNTYINTYELDMDAVKVLSLDRDSKWYEYINNNRQYRDALLIYFTDGYGDYEIPKPKAYKVLWVVTGSEERISMEEPYGKIVKMEKEYE